MSRISTAPSIKEGISDLSIVGRSKRCSIGARSSGCWGELVPSVLLLVHYSIEQKLYGGTRLYERTREHVDLCCGGAHGGWSVGFWMDDGIPDRDTSKARQGGLEVAKVNFLAK